MKKRAWVIVGVVAAVVIGALAATYLTGLVVVGDPFSGLWNRGGQPVGVEGGSGYLIKQTDDGYVFTAVAGTSPGGWRQLQRHGRTLDGKWGREEFTFEYQPWNGHLAYTYREQPSIVVHMALKKAPNSTAVLPEGN
jgi:hypothetical protein